MTNKKSKIRVGFYNVLVILATLMCLHITYLETSSHCRIKNFKRLVMANLAQFRCTNSECIQDVYDHLSADKRADWCKYVNYGE